MSSTEGPERQGDEERGWEADDLERASENVLGPWPSAQLEDPPPDPRPSGDLDGAAELGPPPDLAPEPDEEPVAEEAPDEAAGVDSAPADTVVEDRPLVEDDQDAEVAELPETTGEHAPGELAVPPGYPLLEGEARGARRAVGIVVSRFNGEVTGGLLDASLAELERLGVEPDSITVMPVPGAFELPLAAMALAKTRRFACIVALGCVIRGDTPHFDYVASEAASGLQLAAIETGVPVSFGVLTLDRPDQAAPRLEKGAEAVRTALEMADLFANLRAAAAR
jgi:6,7-dimethyl-8-ribityllumazine synthase